jgi:hypothetical protein
MNRVLRITFAVLITSALLTLVWLILGARPWSRPSILLDGSFWFMLLLLLSPYAILALIAQFGSSSATRSLVALFGCSVVSFAGAGVLICETFSRSSLGDGFIMLFLSVLQWIGSGITALVILFIREPKTV